MDLALNNLQRLICHKTQQTKPNQTEIQSRPGCELVSQYLISNDGGAILGVTVTIVGKGLGSQSSNPGRNCLHFP